MSNLSENLNQNTKTQEFTLLLVDDEESTKEGLDLALVECGRGLATSERLRIIHAQTVASALDLLAGNPIHIAIIDKNLGSKVPFEDQNGIEAIPDMLRLQPHLQILVLSGSSDIAGVVRAMDLGAASYMTKDKPAELLVTTLNRLLQNSLVRIQAIRAERGLRTDPIGLGGKSKVFKKILKQAEQVALVDGSIILFGETGTGKTELARWIHNYRNSLLKQKDSPFFGINVSALSKEVIENELFGHDKGAYTDAQQSKPGLFELAGNGTLFLDEIGDLPLELQPKLLQVVQQRTYMKVGGDKILTSNAKLIFATHRDLKKMVEEGTFRKDLYMRITALPIHMPSLSERREDIPDIIRALLPRACSENRVFLQFEDLPQDFIEYLVQNPVDGNIRGIQHQLERLLVFSPKNKHGKPVFTRWRAIDGFSTGIPESTPAQVSVEQMNHVPITFSELTRRPWSILNSDFPGLKQALSIFEDKIVDEASKKFKTNRETAKVLRIPESTSSGLLRSKKT